jgi:MFS superfamily sulfate permease-like transporter
VATVGLIPQGLPSITLPDLALVEQLLPGALGIALMSFTESIAAGRAFMAGGDPPINANRELVATGVANLGGALLGAMPAGGGTSQTAVVRAVGGVRRRPRWSPPAPPPRPCCCWRPCSACCRTPRWRRWSSSIRWG